MGFVDHHGLNAQRSPRVPPVGGKGVDYHVRTAHPASPAQKVDNGLPYTVVAPDGEVVDADASEMEQFPLAQLVKVSCPRAYRLRYAPAFVRVSSRHSGAICTVLVASY
jgi:hypothetical protein